MSLTLWVQEIEDDDAVVSFDDGVSKGLPSSSTSAATAAARSVPHPTSFLHRPTAIDEYHDPRTLIYLADIFPSELYPAYHSMEASSLLQAALEAQAEAELKAAQAARLAEAAAAAAAEEERQERQLRSAVIAAARQRMEDERRQLEQAIEEEGLLDLMGARLLALRGYETAGAGTRGGYAQELPHRHLLSRGGTGFGHGHGYAIAAIDEDEPELDWLGAELASARSGAPLWIIDAGAEVIVDEEGHQQQQPDAMQIDDDATLGASPLADGRSHRITIQPTVELADASRPTTPRAVRIQSQMQPAATSSTSISSNAPSTSAAAGTTRLASEMLDGGSAEGSGPVVSAGIASAPEKGGDVAPTERNRQPTVMTEEEEAELEKSRPVSPSRLGAAAAASSTAGEERGEQRPNKTVKVDVTDLRSAR